MSFADAVRTCLSKYVDFSGRARRSEYWWFYLAAIVLIVVGIVIDGVVGTTSVFQGLASLAILLPSLAAGVRRLHDTDRSGWMILLGLIPLAGPIILLVFFVQDSKPGANQYGPNPKMSGEVAYGAPA